MADNEKPYPDEVTISGETLYYLLWLARYWQAQRVTGNMGHNLWVSRLAVEFATGTMIDRAVEQAQSACDIAEGKPARPAKITEDDYTAGLGDDLKDVNDG